MAKFLAWIVVIIGGTGFVVISVVGFGLWTAWWLLPGWEWFLVPLGVPKIGLLHLWGLRIFLKWESPELKAKDPEGTKHNWQAWFASHTLGPVLAWLFMWLLHRWM
jgi:hypothetical protein